MKRARRFLCGVLFAPCLLAMGCIPYAYPKLSYVPSCELGPAASEVHAFRVDLTADVALISDERGEYTVSEIALRPDGSIPPQSRMTVERGVFFFTQLGRRHTTHVRLYRPGYQLVELNAWDLTDKIAWYPAPDWLAQERAIDTLLGRTMLTPSFSASIHRNNDLPHPPSSLATERAFVFAAAEYERVAKLAPTPEDAARLHEKAKKLVEMKPASIVGSRTGFGTQP